jgi:hypothetical protein
MVIQKPAHKQVSRPFGLLGKVKKALAHCVQAYMLYCFAGVVMVKGDCRPTTPGTPVASFTCQIEKENFTGNQGKDQATGQDKTEQEGTERNGTERNGTERNGTERRAVSKLFR